MKDHAIKQIAMNDTWINQSFKYFMMKEDTKKTKAKVKQSLQYTMHDPDVRSSVNNKKMKDLETLNKEKMYIPKSQEAMFKELMIADWTGSFADTLTYSFNLVSKYLVKKLLSFNIFTNQSEVLKNIFLFMNICITHDKLHLFCYYLKITQKSKHY